MKSAVFGAVLLVSLAFVAAVSGQAVESFSPRSGPQTGQTLLTITGKAFRNTGSIQLLFVSPNDRTVIPVTYINDNILIATTGRFNVSGEHDVSISFDGSTYSSLNTRFIVYSNTFPDSFQPLSGPASGGSDLLILGKFVNTGEIRVLLDIFNEEYLYLDAVYVDEFTLRAVTKRFPVPGKYDVNIALNGQQFVAFSEFYIAYDQDLLDSFSPSSGPIAGGTTFSVRGSGFSDTGEHTIAFVDARGNRQVVFADWVDSTLLTTKTPVFSVAGVHTVEVAQNGQDYEVLDGAFTVY